MYQYELNEEEFPSECIPMVVAVMEDCSQRELQQLAERIDPDALNRLLVDGSDDPVRIQFPYSGYVVTVTHNEIQITEDLRDFP